MTINQWVMLLLTGLGVFIPIPQFFKWLRSEFGNAPKELLGKSTVFFDGTLLLIGWTILFQFLKGFGVVWALNIKLENPLVAAIGIVIMMSIQYWVGGRLSHRPYSWYLVWGIATGLNPIWLIMFPVLLFGIALLFDSFDLSMLIATGIVAIWLIINQESLGLIIGGLGLFVLTASAYLGRVLRYFEGKDGLVQRFDNRK